MAHDLNLDATYFKLIHLAYQKIYHPEMTGM